MYKSHIKEVEYIPLCNKHYKEKRADFYDNLLFWGFAVGVGLVLVAVILAPNI